MTGTASFRDPGGYVSVREDRVIRTVLPQGRANLDAYLNSPAAHRFIDAGSLISTMPIDEQTVEHPRIPFASYAHEWPAAMLRAAGRLTLDLCSALLEERRCLKDATPSNVLFRGPQPVFIDVLSVENRDPHDAIWLADAQFARTFLIPLLLYRRTGCPVHEHFLMRRDGIPPEDAQHRLPRFRRWFPPDLGLVTLPAKAAKVENQNLYCPHHTKDTEEARFILAHHFRALQKKLDALAPRSAPAVPSTQPAAHREFVARALNQIRPARVLNVGASGCEFSLMAAAAGASVVFIDGDAEAVSAMWHSAVAADADILPLVVDLARPTPPAGWLCSENAGFIERAQNYFDCAVLFDISHQIMVAGQIPLARIFDALAALTTRWLLIEYVGPQDPAFQRLARGRDALYRWYGRPVFEDCATSGFEIVNSVDIASSDRALYLLRRKS